jgi:hypothetical protein
MVHVTTLPAPLSASRLAWRRALGCALAGMALAGHAGWAQSQDGQGMAWTSPKAAPMWPHWEGRIGVVLDQADVRSPSFSLGLPGSGGLKLRSAHLLSDYHFSGGFRATAGLIHGSTSLPWWGKGGLNTAGLNLSLENTDVFNLPTASSSMDDTPRTVAYVGAGYSARLNDAKAYGVWNFNADLGVISLNSGSIGRLSRVLQGDQGVDELVRDLKLRPVLKVSVDYAF